MKNIAIFKTMLDKYNAAAFTHNYIFGYTDRGNVYMTIADASTLPFVLCQDNASRGCGYSVRFKPTKAQKELLKTQQTTILCSVEYFNTCVKESIYNKGEIFEKIVTEFFGQVWEKDNVPFTQAGDIEANGVAYQIKFQNATFCNEKSLANLC